MVAFIGNTLRGKVSGDESIASRQNSSDFSPIKVLRYTVTQLVFPNGTYMHSWLIVRVAGILVSVSVLGQYQHILMVLELVKYIIQVPILFFVQY